MRRGFLNGSKMNSRPLYPTSADNQNIVEVPIAMDASDSAQKRETFQLPYENVENSGEADINTVRKLYELTHDITILFTTAPPESFKLKEVAYKGLDARRSDHPENALLMTTIPSINGGDLPDPDGHSEWIVTGPTKTRVLNAPGYPLAIPKATGLPAYELRSTQDMGLGVFATRDIKVGELIFAERPLLVLPRNIGLLAPGVSVPLGSADLHGSRMAILKESEKTLEIAVGRMSPENQKAFKGLANMHTKDGCGPLMGVVRTNGYHIDTIYDGEQLLELNQNGYTAICNLGSRINHSCAPNIDNAFAMASSSFQFRASRDIEAGEQLFHSYCGVDLTATERKAELAPYGIVCSCAACAHATPE
ncbi:hypothetical protein CVT25_000819, partial [Psilocybe cyanescens]